MINSGVWEERDCNVKDALHALTKSGSSNLSGKPLSSIIAIYNRLYNYYDGISLAFRQLNIRHPEVVAMYIYIDSKRIKWISSEMLTYNLFVEDLVIRSLCPAIKELNDSYINDNKAEHLISKIEVQSADSTVIRRSTVLYNKKTNTFVIKLKVIFPTGSGSTILGKRTAKFILSILKLIDEKTTFGDCEENEKSFSVYKKQQQIRKWCSDNGYVSFVADGSILPRAGDTDNPNTKAIPFRSPEQLRVTIPFDDGSQITGMGLKQGVTIITGAGFSGKTTLLEAIDSGIYDHIPGDGREFVITDKLTLVTNAEDGRFIGNTDMSPFFKKIPGHDYLSFCTNDASGSVSQAANIIEAIQAGAKLLLIDEDKSATNFMICDRRMRQMVTDEIIIPFTDRIDELVRQRKLSCIIVIGGSSEYFRYADNILLMKEYNPQTVDEAVLSGFRNEKRNTNNLSPVKISDRYLNVREEDITKLLFRVIKAEKIKKVIVGQYSADVSAISEIKEDNQLQGLAAGVFNTMILAQKEKKKLTELVNAAFETYWEKIIHEGDSYDSLFRQWFISEVRPIEVIMTINRMRGFEFENKKDNE